MNTIKQELRQEFTWLEGFREPLKEMRRELCADIASQKYEEDKTGD